MNALFSHVSAMLPRTESPYASKGQAQSFTLLSREHELDKAVTTVATSIPKKITEYPAGVARILPFGTGACWCERGERMWPNDVHKMETSTQV